MARTTAASAIAGTGAVLNGTVTAGGLGTVSWFEWGTDLLYGNVTAATNLDSGAVAVPVSTALAGLTPGVLYHYRILATNALGAVGGMDRLVEIPVLALNGSDPFTNECHSSFPDPGVSAQLLAAAAGTTHNLSLKSDGLAVGWGNNQDGESAAPPEATNLVAIAAGDKFSLGLRADGRVIQWGFNNYGQMIVPARLTNAVAIAAGGNDALALQDDGTVVNWAYYGSDYIVPADATNVVAVAAGSEYNLVLRSDGTLFGWGIGQAAPPAGLSNVAAIAVGLGHSLALKRDGTIVGWGYNYYGQAAPPAGLSNVVAIAAGNNHSLALQRDGTVVGWGNNSAGQAYCRYFLFNVMAIAAGGDHSLALESQGAVIAWGDDSFLEASSSTEATLTNRLGVSGAVDTNTPGTYTLTYHATNALGGVAQSISRNVIVADTTPPVITLLGTTPVVVPLHGWFADPGATAFDACYGDLTGGLTTNGVVNPDVPGIYRIAYSVADSAGNISRATREVWVGLAVPQTLPASKLAGNSASLNGLVGLNGVGATVFFEFGPSIFYGNTSTVTNFTAGTNVAPVSILLPNVAPGLLYHYRMVATNSGGRVNGADATFELPLLNLTGLSPMTNECHVAYSEPGLKVRPYAISAGGSYSLGVLGDGTAVASGDATAAVPAFLSNLVAVAAGESHALGLRNDGTVAIWGNNSYGQLNMPAGLANVAAIAAGWGHSLALRNDGTAVAWGYNSDGQAIVPPGESNLVAVAAGTYHSAALRRDGTVLVWGNGALGQTNLPAGLTNVVAIAAGGYKTMALKGDGTVVVWGDSSFGQTTPPASATNLIGIAAGFEHCLALRGDGTVVAWGYDYYHQTDTPSLYNVTAIATGDFHSLALTQDGTVHGWGNDSLGQTSLPLSAATLPANLTMTGAVDPNTLGTYLLSYTVTNGFGAIATITRTVIVADRTPPRLTMFGGNPILLALNSSFNDPGVSATDTCAGVLTSAIVTNGTVDTSVRASYVVSYTVTDPSGNTATTNRTVRVGAPLIATLGASSVSGTNAILNAQVNPNGGLTAAWFQWGVTTNYGNVSATNMLASGTSALSVSAGLVGLLAGTTYHFRILATNDIGGIIAGVDKTFVTPTVLQGKFGPPTNQFVLRVTANTGTLYSVWASPDPSLPFANWTFLGRPTVLSNNSLQFIDSRASNFTLRFYRLRSP